MFTNNPQEAKEYLRKLRRLRDVPPLDDEEVVKLANNLKNLELEWRRKVSQAYEINLDFTENTSDETKLVEICLAYTLACVNSHLAWIRYKFDEVDEKAIISADEEGDRLYAQILKLSEMILEKRTAIRVSTN